MRLIYEINLVKEKLIMQEDEDKLSGGSDLEALESGNTASRAKTSRAKTAGRAKTSRVKASSKRKKPSSSASKKATGSRVASGSVTDDKSAEVEKASNETSNGTSSETVEVKTSLWSRIWNRFRVRHPVVAVVPLHGVIGTSYGLPSRRSGVLSAMGLEEQLVEAFKVKGLKAVALSVNSPGGSPVQSSLIASRIRSLASENKVEVLTFCQDVAASGGYWLACSGDKIYADKSSIVGSIGVISAGFGFEKMIKKIGVDRRIITQGENKSRLDPFMPLNNKDVQHIKEIQKDIHCHFIEYVKERRKDLKAGDKKLFSGDFWTGNDALKIGLIDEIGNMHEVCQQRFGKKVRLKIIKGKKGWFQGIFQAEFTQNLVDALIDRAKNLSLWQRFGL